MAEEEIDKHVLRKYEVLQKLGKGVSFVFWEALVVFVGLGPSADLAARRPRTSGRTDGRM